jgi:hypothetical protein
MAVIEDSWSPSKHPWEFGKPFAQEETQAEFVRCPSMETSRTGNQRSAPRDKAPMKFTIEVGEVEKQRVEFSFNQLLGRTVIRSNGRDLKKSVRLFSEPLFDRHIFDFAEKERVELKIEKQRRNLFASRYFVFVNNRLTQCFQGI